MSGPADDRALHDRARDDIATLALGEDVDPRVAAHVAACTDCDAELRAYTDVVSIARTATRNEDGAERPADAVWHRIETAVADRVPATPTRRPHRRTRHVLLAAAAVVLVCSVAVGGWLIGRGDGGRGADTSSSQAALQAQPGTTERAHGRATMASSRDGFTMQVDTSGLPARTGYYEVWLYDPSVGQMVAIGTLGAGGRGSFTVPGGIDLHAYHVVDVSAQSYQAGPAHARSVLRGPLSH